MSQGLQKRLSRLEQYVARRTEKPLICNCKEATRYHNSACLAELLRKMPRVCPIHGFRDLHFLRLYPEGRLLQEDRQFCPCVANPWNAFIRGPGPHTLEGLYVVQKAFCKETLPGHSDFDDDDDILREIEWEEEVQDVERGMRFIDEYDKTFGKWWWETGQGQFVSRRELARLESQRVRRYKELLREVADEYVAYLKARILL